MVHCVSSSEPDSADHNSQGSDQDWRRSHQISTNPKSDYADVTSAHSHFSKKSPPSHVTFAESSNMVTGLQYINDQVKHQEAVVSSRNYEKMMQHKRKNSSDTVVVMEAHHMHTSLFEDDEGKHFRFILTHVDWNEFDISSCVLKKKIAVPYYYNACGPS